MAVAACGFCAAFFLYEPQLSVFIDDRQDVVELAIFLVIAALISQFFGDRQSRFELWRI
jgi:K+-sensing histidine kinase KdpD